MRRSPIALASLGLVAATAVVPTASADTGVRGATLRSTTVANGPACAGQVFAQATSTRRLHTGPGSAPRNNRGVVYLSIGGTFFGISERPGTSCRVDAAVRWRNLRTGASGKVTGPVSGLLLPAAPHRMVSRDIRTGSGPVEFILSTTRPQVVDRAVVQVY